MNETTRKSLRHVDPKHLKHFVSVYRAGSFRGAADELGVSQSAMTKSIAALEADLALRLFHRTTRMVEPTDSARRLLPTAETVLSAMNSFTEEARLLAGGDLGSLRVGAIALASETLIGATLSRLAQTHPKLDIDVVLGSADVYRDLATGECDVAVGDEANFIQSAHARSLRMVPVREEPIVLVHRSHHPGRGARALAEFISYPLAIPSRYYNENHLFEAFRRRGGPEAPRYRLNSVSSCLQLAARSNVVTVAPLSVAVDAAAGQEVEVAAIDLETTFRLALVTLAANSPTPAMRAFQDAICAPQEHAAASQTE